MGPLGVADLDHDDVGRTLLRITLGAIPEDPHLYIPLRELLLLGELPMMADALAQQPGHA